MAAVDTEAEALSRFYDAAIDWAIGGRGQQIVDAAAQALAEGLDSPNLRMLAGVPHKFADDEASHFAPLAFQEVGLEVSERLSPGAYVDSARREAGLLLAGVISERELAGRLSAFGSAAAYSPELATWIGFDDYYELFDDGVINPPVSALDEAVRSAAEDLVHRRRGQLVTLASLLSAPAVEPEPRRDWLSRILRRQ